MSYLSTHRAPSTESKGVVAKVPCLVNIVHMAHDESLTPRAGAGESPRDAAEQPAPKAAESVKPRPFVGSAMKALFESADVSIKRDDETRVMSRAQETLAKLEAKTAPERERGSDRPPTFASSPPGPRVDMVLWIVLAVGLFGIAGWMLAYGI